MNLRAILAPLALAALVLGAPRALHADDPAGSFIVNRSSQDYQVRISDKVGPAGVVNFYAEHETSPLNKKPVKSKGDAFIIHHGETVRMVICGSDYSPKKSVVALHLSLDELDAKGSAKQANVHSIHVVHLLFGGKKITFADVLDHDVATQITKQLGISASDLKKYCPGGEAAVVECTPGSFSWSDTKLTSDTVTSKDNATTVIFEGSAYQDESDSSAHALWTVTD